MKLSEKWLRQWVNPALSTSTLAEQMSMIGLTVDHIFPVAGVFSDVVIGQVIATQPHPNASRLTCCEVNIGESSPLRIVCGAANVRAHLKVAVAKVGAVLPNDVHIQSAKIRGEPSQGMICSPDELNLYSASEHTPGILELPSDAPVGKNFYDYIEADDHIFDIEITPNRGDALSVLGIARDIAAKNKLNIQNIQTTSIKPAFKSPLKIQVAATVECPRYIGCHIKNINNRVETPSGIQRYLQRAGIRLINPVVDICNYVMCELGQPMHAFDYSRLQGSLHIRCAKQHEKIQLLDEQTIALSTEDLVIADEKEARCLAGIMGGMSSAVSAETTEIFLEAAFFSPKTICLSTRRHHIRSDSSYRFERGVDFHLPVRAMERAVNLLLPIIGGEPSGIMDVTAQSDLPKREKIILRRDQIKRIVGIGFSDDLVMTTLHSLGMQVKTVASGWEVIPPSYRFDISLEIDLIEECVRILGYDTIPAEPMQGLLMIPDSSEKRLSNARIRTFFVDRHYHECITYSFISPELQRLFFPNEQFVQLHNPIVSDLSVMRTSLWPGLLKTIESNTRHQCDRVRLFEMGMCFTPSSQIEKFACAITGTVAPEQWSLPQTSADFYDLKSDISALLFLSKKNYAWKKSKNTACHPGRCAALYDQDKLIGWLGEIHPAILPTLALKKPVIVFEVILDEINQLELPQFKEFSRFPSIRRDLAIIVEEAVTAEQLQNVIQENIKSHLKEVQIFDVYYKDIAAGKKSIALGLTFQDASRTLRDEEINEVIQGVVTALTRELQATLRT